MVVVEIADEIVDDTYNVLGVDHIELANTVNPRESGPLIVMG